MFADKDTLRGVGIMLLATAVLAVSDTLVRLTTETIPIGEFLVIRGSITSTIILLFIITKYGSSILRQVFHPFVILRALLETGSVVLYIIALQHLLIAEVTAIYLASPLIASAIIVATGMQKVNRRSWIALFFGFLGVLLVMTPDLETFRLAAIPALGSAALVATRDIVTRMAPAAVSVSAMTLCTTITVGSSGVFLFPFEGGWEVPSQPEVILLVSAAIVLCAGNFLAVAAFRKGEVAVVSLFRYASLPFAILVGFIVWAEFPSNIQILGSVIVIVSGMVILRSRSRRVPSTQNQPKMKNSD